MTTHYELAPRNTKQAMWRGFCKKCPSCGEGYLFTHYIRVHPQCLVCKEELYHQKADDAPPYFTIMAVGHIIVPSLLLMEIIWHPAIWLHVVIWLPLTILLTFDLLPRFKGLTIGLQWALRMHGFASVANDR